MRTTTIGSFSEKEEKKPTKQHYLYLFDTVMALKDKFSHVPRIRIKKNNKKLDLFKKTCSQA